MEKEIRYFETLVEFEKREDGTEDDNVLIGHASVFNSDSVDLGGFIERVEPGAFDDVMDDDAYALFNHDANLVLGRNKVNTTLSQTSKGLKYRTDLPKTTVAQDLKVLVRSGIITKSSFGFTVKEQRWEHRKGQPSIRTILKIGRLYDVSPVTFPAYPDTTVATRSMKENNKLGLSLEERQFKLKIRKQ